MGLRFRIAITILVLEACLVAAVLFVTLRYVQQTTRAQFEIGDKVTINLLDDLARIALLTDDFAELQAFVEETRNTTRLQSVALADLSGQVVAASDTGRIGDDIVPNEVVPGIRSHLVPLGAYGLQLGTLAVEFNDGDLQRALNTAYRRGFLIAVAGMVVIAFVSIGTGHFLTRRLSRLARVADRVAGGDMNLRVNIKGRDETARVGIAMNGMLDRLSAQIHDVTQSRDRLYVPTEAIHDGFAIWNAEDRLVLFNSRFVSFYKGVPVDPKPGLKFEDFVRATVSHTVNLNNLSGEEWIERRIAYHREGDSSFEVRLRDGRWLHVDERRMADGGVVAIYNEVTEAKNREQALLDSQDRLRLIMDSVGEGIATLDETGKIEAINKAMEKLFERSTDDLVGRPFHTLFMSRGDSGQTELSKITSGGLTTDGFERIAVLGKRKSGTFPVEIGLNSVSWRGQSMYIASIRDVTEQHQAHSMILHQATHDALTGLPNRALIDDRLEQAISAARRTDKSCAVLFLDIDHFKSINDTLGHTVGDELLVKVAERLRSCVREGDTVARMGGDEFLLVIGDLPQPQDVLKPVRKILLEIRKSFSLQGRDVHIRASLGIAFFPFDADDRTQLLKNADIALYRAKEHGRNRFELFDASMRDQATERGLLEADLRQALADDDLYLVYQPQFDMASGHSIGLEALARWNHPRHGDISPALFIPLAEECGLINDVGAWAVQQACQDLIGWRAGGISVSRIAVNVSPRQLNDELFEQVSQSLQDANLDPSYLELELTETALIRDRQPAARAISRLRALGVGLALDDFGTGYSSLSHLRRYPIQRVKVDRTFVRDLASDPADMAVVRAVVGLSHGLGMRVVAEGIESNEQLTILRKMGCDEGQGFFLARPCRARDIPSLLELVPG